MGDNPGGTVQVQFHPHQDPDADPPESRLASWEEVVSALAHVAPRGAAFTIPPIVALDPDDLEPMYGRTAFLLVQVGWAQPLHSDIIIPKGPELIQ